MKSIISERMKNYLFCLSLLFVMSADLAASLPRRGIRRLPLSAVQQPVRQRAARAPRRIPIGADHAPLVGTHRELIILVNFADMTFQEGHDRTLFDRLANEAGFADMSLGMYGSVRDYFSDQSDGLFTMHFDVVGPVTLPHPYAYYGRNDTRYKQDVNPAEMIVDAVRAVDDKVDFSQYDNDGDGFVDQVFVIYAGTNESAGGEANTIWPHKYNLSLDPVTDYKPLSLDGILVDDYACTSELTWYGYDETGTQLLFGLSGIGTLCHEFSHCLGLPDVYDVAYENYGMNTWDIMDAGEWNGINAPGMTPAAYTAYERMYCGWRQPTELRGDTVVRGVKPISQGGETFIVRNQAHPDEYYLIENRQMTGWDQALEGRGLVVSHVDFDAQVWEYNEVNCTKADRVQTGNDHQRLHIIAADNSFGTYKEDPVTGAEYYDYEDVMGDAYPYRQLDSLTNTSTPRANLYNSNTDGRKLMNAAITHIRQNDDGTMDFAFRLDATGDDSVGETAFYESFDQCSGTGGNDGLWGGSASVASTTLRPDHGGWSTANAYGGHQCARFGGSRGTTIAETPEFAVNGTLQLTFRAAPWQGDGTALQLSAYSADNAAADFRLGQTQFTMREGQWTEFTTTITGYGKLQLRFKPDRRFFLDEVRIGPSEGHSAVIALPFTRGDETLYDLSGRHATKNMLRKGGIFVKKGKKRKY